jgi:hypothetical protein
MDRIDLITFMGASYMVSWLTGISGTELVGSQMLWLVGAWIGKRLIDRWIDRKFA